MGRALFSTIYHTAPAVHEEPEAEPADVPGYGTWGQRNKFDPDSDEFFDGAEYEAFLLDEDLSDQSVPALTHSSHMAVGEDPAAALYAASQTQRSRVFRLSAPQETPYRIIGARTHSGAEQSDVQASTRILLDRANATSVPVGDAEEEPLTANGRSGASLTLPIDIPGTSTPSSGSESSAPATPPQAFSFGSLGTPQSYGFSMSPPPAESPRIYTWGRNARYSGSPGSASSTRGPLTNPSARASFPRIISASPALRA